MPIKNSIKSTGEASVTGVYAKQKNLRSEEKCDGNSLATIKKINANCVVLNPQFQHKWTCIMWMAIKTTVTFTI